MQKLLMLVIDTNPKACKLLGYSNKEFAGIHYTKLHPSEDRKRIIEAFNRIKKQKTFRIGDVRVEKKDSSVTEVDINGACIHLGDKLLVYAIFREMSEYKERQEQLITARKNLEAQIAERTMELMEANTALKVLISHREHEKAENEEKLLNNLKAQIFPYINDLTKEPLNTKQKATIKMLEKNLQNIMSEFLTRLQSNVSKFTPKEIQVASLIKEDMSTKDIARMMNVSTKTVDIFRYNIRKKLGLNNRKASLRSHLLSL